MQFVISYIYSLKYVSLVASLLLAPVVVAALPLYCWGLVAVVVADVVLGADSLEYDDLPEIIRGL